MSTCVSDPGIPVSSGSDRKDHGRERGLTTGTQPRDKEPVDIILKGGRRGT